MNARTALGALLVLALPACGRPLITPSTDDDIDHVRGALTSGAVRVNSGGPATGTFVADTDFSGGATLVRTNPIDLSGVVNPAPMAVYQSQRYNNMTYSFPGFAAGSNNDIRLHFADTKWTAANQRLFNVTINGTPVLSNFDVIGTAGAPNKAVVESFSLPASASGNYVIAFVGTKDATMVSAIEIGATPAGACDPSALSSAGWVATASASHSPDVPARALDGNTSTRWTTGIPQASGQYFQLDLQTPQTFSRLVMNAAASAGEFAHKYNVFVSNDGTNFGSPVGSGIGAAQIETVDFPAQTARFIRVVLTGAASTEWSIHEVKVFTSGCNNSGATTGTLTIGGTLKDASGAPIVGGRINLSGAAQAVRFSDFAGGYVFHVAPGTYSLSAAAECALSPAGVTFTNMTANQTQAFTATNGACATARPTNVTATGEQLTFVKGGVSLATTYVRVESRADAADAQARLLQIGSEQPGSTSTSVAGNAAVERQTTVTLPGLMAGHGDDDADENVSQFKAVTMAVAVGASVVRFETQLGLDAAADTLARVLAAGRNFQPEDAPSLHGAPAVAIPTSRTTPPLAPAVAGTTVGAPFGPGNFGELEVAASDLTSAVVYGRQGGPFFSLDGGQTVQAPVFNRLAAAPSATPRPAGDPSVYVGAPVIGQNQTFYFSELSIAQVIPPMGAAPQVIVMAIALSTSTDNGATFNGLSFPVNCAAMNSGCIVPDQPLLAVDRFNRAATPPPPAAATGTADQVYVSWRNFPAAGPRTAAVACSADGGTTWIRDTATMAATGADFARLTVAPDGSLLALYAVYSNNGTYKLMAQKWTSCANKFTPLPVVTVATVTEVTAMAGLDRNPAGNYSAAFDDTDATGQRLYVVFSNETSPGNDDVTVLESLDGGRTFARTSIVNTSRVGQRFFPRICSTRGTQHVSWYDRRNATPAAQDLTGYYRSTVFDVPTSFTTVGIGTEVNVSGVDDPECSSGFPSGVRAGAAETTCGGDLPAGFITGGTCTSVCPMGAPAPCGSLNRCDFRVANPCPTAAGVPVETCTPGGGQPKYGDYNGNACARGSLFMAWASSTPPPGASCSVNGLACTAAASCCSGNCVGGACAPTPAACTINGGACGPGLPACCSSASNGRCDGGQCVAAVAAYTGATGVGGPFLTAHGDLTQIDSEPMTICGTGQSFTPNGTVQFTIEYHGQGTDVFRTLSSVTADANGNFAYSVGPNFYNDADCSQFPNVRFSASDRSAPGPNPKPAAQVILQACRPNGAVCQ